MHFFIDYQQLPVQSPTDSFGPDTTNPTTIYNLSSKFQLTTEAKAYASQRGLIIVQQSDEDASLVNIILKPTTKLSIPFQDVAYYVYRGILKSSLINGSNITSKDANTNNDIVTRIYSADPKTTSYSASILGFDNTVSANADIGTLFNSSNSTIKSFLVEEGEWFGSFTNSHKISFEIVTEPEKVDISIGYLRKGESVIDATGITGFDLISKKDEILAFIDPAAFFGLHYKVGINIPLAGNPNTTTTLKGNDIYINLLSPFFTKNRVYLDIRSEYGFSYNFYRNYLNENGNNLKLSFGDVATTERNYATNGWPIIFVDAPQSSSTNENHLQLNLRIDDNLKPILFFEDKAISENSQDNFVDEEGLLIETNTDWTKEVGFKFPNTGENATKDNVAYYLQMYYFRQAFNPHSPPTVLRKELNIDSFFAPIDLPHLGDENYIFKQLEYTKPIFITGEHPQEDLNPDPTPVNLKPLLVKSNSFSQVVGSGAYYDSGLTVFYSKLRISKKQSGRLLSSTLFEIFGIGINLNDKLAKQSFLANDLGVSTIQIQEMTVTDTFQQVNLLNVFANKNVQHKIEDIALLGLTTSEIKSLQNITGLSHKHPRQLVFQSVYPALTDKNGIPYNKYTLHILGLDDNGNSAKLSPATEVYVYSAKDAFVLASQAFTNLIAADQKVKKYFVQEPIIQNGITYEKLPLENSIESFRTIGISETRGNTEDLKYGVDTGPYKVYIIDEVKEVSDFSLFSFMSIPFSYGTSFGLDIVAADFITKFFSNDSNTNKYGHPDLNDRVADNSRYINYVKSFGKDLENKLRATNGLINNINTIVYPSKKSSPYNNSNDDQKRPTFGQKYDYVHGLTILIDDTESTVISLEKYENDPITFDWSAIVRVEILDHFGLDYNDIATKQNGQDLPPLAGIGFAAWWVLQHRRGYVPFITQVNTRCKLTGNYK